MGIIVMASQDKTTRRKVSARKIYVLDELPIYDAYNRAVTLPRPVEKLPGAGKREQKWQNES